MVGSRPLIHRNVYRLLQTALQAVGLPHQRLYNLRHICASLLLAQGASMREIMEILGHSQMSVTSDTNRHIYNEQGKGQLRADGSATLHEANRSDMRSRPCGYAGLLDRTNLLST
ncbi:MAG: tyrosine-type recombinase/integrase [Chloroflexota bacterium]|nr:tyrosine-type recombinase/integrase [Chloroflexota bacterium]MDQ5865759.1 tyrosine-type recombinase/integrase [Chloroflexota bacterium]